MNIFVQFRNSLLIGFFKFVESLYFFVNIILEVLQVSFDIQVFDVFNFGTQVLFEILNLILVFSVDQWFKWLWEIVG